MVRLNAIQKDNRNKCISFADEIVNKSIAHRDKERLFDRELWQNCQALNLHGIFTSKDLNGSEYDLQNGMSLLESTGYAFRDNGLTFSIAAQLLSCTMSIEKYATQPHHKALIRDIVSGQKIVAHAITENSSGSDVFQMSSFYESGDDGKSLHINGHKTYCTNLPVADYVLCYVNKQNAEKECSAFLIPKEKLNNIATIEKMGLNTCLMGQTELNVTLSKHDLLNNEGEGMAMFQEAITYERVGMSALHLGTIERLLKESIDWVNKREASNGKLNQYQSITHPLVNIHNEWLVLRNYLYQITSEKISFSKLYMHASIIKDKVSELYVNSCQTILQIYGGIGYTKQNEIERMLRDAMASKIYSGTSEIQKEIVWKFIS